MNKKIIGFLVSAAMLVCMSLAVCAESQAIPTQPGYGGDSSTGGATLVYTNTVYTDGVYKVSANVPEGSLIIFACYEDEALAFVDFLTYTSENADSIQFAVDDEIAYDSAKVFVWDGFSVMNSVKNPEIVNVTKITPLTELVVIDNVSTGFNEKMEQFDIIYAYTSEGNRVKSFYVDSDTSLPGLDNGDVVVLGVGSDGEVIEVKKLYTPDNSEATVEAMWNMENTNHEWGTGICEHYLKTGIEAFDNTYSTDDHWARVGFGIIIDKGSNWINVVKVREATAEEAAIEGAGIEIGDPVSDSAEAMSLSFNYDVNVYVYDYNDRPGFRAAKGSTGSLVKTFVSATNIAEKGGSDIYCWKRVPSKNYVFYKITDGIVTDIMIIKPKN